MEDGDTAALNRLMPYVYDDLRQLAGAIFKGQEEDHTLQPTVLVHEAYVRLVKPDKPNWHSRKHFYRAAAMAMRQLLTDYARARNTEKRGGGAHQVMLHENLPITEHGRGIHLIALDEALERLQKLDKRQAQIVELRFLAGFSVAETAEILEVSERTVSLDWTMARAWLQRELEAENTA